MSERIEKEEEGMLTPEKEVETAGKPPKEAAKKPWIAVIAIIVVIALIGAGLAVMFLGKKPFEPHLDGKVSVSSVSLALGEQVRIIAYAEFWSAKDASENVSAETGVTWSWQPTTAGLGTLSSGLTDDGLRYVTVKSTTVGSSSIRASFLYLDAETGDTHTATADVSITVGPAALSYVDVIPASKTLLKDQSQEFSAVAYMTDGSVAEGATFTWELSDDTVGEISDAVGNVTTFTAGSEAGSTNLTCVATLDAVSVSSSAPITVITELPPESVETKIYDLFNVPFEQWWDIRNDSFILSNTFPYVEVWQGAPAGNNWLYSDARLNTTARNVAKVNTTVAPWYVPVLSPTVRGGNIEISWYGNYLTQAEVDAAPYPETTKGWNDGWFFRWNGTVTMDRTAAKMVLGITEAQLNDFDSWKEINFGTFRAAWGAWLSSEASKWGLYYAYEYPWNPLSETYDIEMVSDNEIVFHIVDHLSWGAETILGRWWSYTFLEYEYWPEDITFNARIGELWSDFDLDMVLQYTLIAWTSTRDGRPAWVFENSHADALKSPPGSVYTSQVNKYETGYYVRIPGNSLYGKTTNAYDYTPWPHNLPTENHTFVIEWPDSNQIVGYIHAGTGVYNNTVTGQVDPRWIEPVPGEVDENIVIDYANRTITLVGPLDMYEWSQTSLAARELQENWTRVGELPRGVPWIEFVVNDDDYQRPIAAISGPSLVKTGVLTTFRSASFDLDGEIVNWTWQLGDGTVAYGPVVEKAWLMVDNYTVSLTVRDNDGLTATDSMIVEVVGNLPPIASFVTDHDYTATVIYGFKDMEITFDASASVDPDGNISNATFHWDFGDGNTDSGQIVTHTYTTVDISTVRLTVTDEPPEGEAPASDDATKRAEIALHPSLPLAKMGLQDRAVVDEVVPITGAMSLSLVGSAIVNWTWDFGDGTAGYDVSVTHSWSSPGTYDVTLIVRDENGNVSLPEIHLIQVFAGGEHAISVELSRHALLPDESADLTITIVDAAGAPVTDFAGTVDISCNVSVGVTVPSSHVFDGSEGGTVTLVDAVAFANEGSYMINVSVQGEPTIRGSEFATVSFRTVEMRIYDIFEYPLNDVWDIRYDSYNGMDERLRSDSPVVELYRPDPIDFAASQLSTTYRLSLEARNVPEIWIDNPTFLPIMGDDTIVGGHAVYDVSFYYINISEHDAGYASGLIEVKSDSNDGWVSNFSGTLTMDRVAAAKIIGLPEDELDPEGWFDMDTIKDDWFSWWLAEEDSSVLGVPGLHDIRASWDGYRAGAWGGWYNLVDNGDGTVTLEFVRITWGEDVLIMRQLYWGGKAYQPNYPNGVPMGILPMEVWLEDFHMVAEIGPTQANVTLDTAVVYGWRAWESDTAPPGTAAYRWEIILCDYMFSSHSMVRLSEMDPWEGLTYTSRDPGSNKFGRDIPWDYVPAVWEMKVGESLVIERPKILAVGYLPEPKIGDFYNNLARIEKWGYATIQPIGFVDDTYVLDAGSGDLRMVGPFYPVIVPHPDDPTVHYEPAPRIELWI